MVEEKYGYEMVDRILGKIRLTSNGAYTAVGTYPFHELVSLMTELSKETELSVSALQKIYGNHLFGVFVKSYPGFFTSDQNAFDFLASLEDKIHPEVQKLYPDAELPTFDIEYQGDLDLVMVYKSARKMGAFAEGLIHGCLNHFGEPVQLKVEAIEDDGSKIRFTISKRV